MFLRRGFTLVELLVVIAIIGMLVGLLLPAVNSAREQGRLTTCKNNLHQLQVACEQHIDKLGFFPSGGWGNIWVGLPDQGCGATQPGSWIYQLLPYLDQEALHDYGKGTSKPSQTQADANPKLISTALPGLYCPTRRTGKAYPLTIPHPWKTVDGAGRTDYAANGGSVYIPMSSIPIPASAPAPGFTWDPSSHGFNGIIATHSQVMLPAVKDNKDTTYLFGEKYMSPEHYTDGKDQGDLYAAMSGDDVSTIRWSCDPSGTMAPPAQDRLNNLSFSGQYHFGSSHSAGWNAVFVSGNVQLIGWGIDPATHVAMSTRDGHEVIDPTKIPK